MAPIATKQPAMPTTDDLLAFVEPDASRRLLQSALDHFADRGFHATTTREISLGAAMSPAALYIHYPSKEVLLFHLSRIAHEASLAAVRSAATGVEGASARIRAIAYAFTMWHARHLALARVAQYEIGALSGQHYVEVAKLRRRTERIVRAEIDQGLRARELDVPDAHGATLAVMALGIDVVRWFRPGGRQTPEALAHSYAELAGRMLRAHEAQ
ncbi:MAG TPA: TetR/AcrR family transcriptional regulator [Acidimicrobiales bacterium]|jgi:AcrR family transcriptional regulator|nr:TetR/AcrR family transcriptional regulator [Acidimicrobiales bacterium]